MNWSLLPCASFRHILRGALASISPDLLPLKDVVGGVWKAANFERRKFCTSHTPALGSL